MQNAIQRLDQLWKTHEDPKSAQFQQISAKKEISKIINFLLELTNEP